MEAERERCTLQSPRSWLLIINLQSPPSHHGGDMKTLLKTNNTTDTHIPPNNVGEMGQGIFCAEIIKNPLM